VWNFTETVIKTSFNVNVSQMTSIPLSLQKNKYIKYLGWPPHITRYLVLVYKYGNQSSLDLQNQSHSVPHGSTL